MEALIRLAAVGWEAESNFDSMADWMVDLQIGSKAVVAVSNIAECLPLGEESALTIL